MKEEQVINAARKLFNKYGFKRVSMDEIAKEARVTKKTIYSYFKSKEDLLKYFIEEEVINMKNIVEELDNEENSYFENVHNVICRLLEYKNENPFIKIIMEEYEVFKNPQLLENLKPIDKAIQNYIREKLIYAKEKEFIDVEDVDVATFLIYKLYIAFLFEAKNEFKDEQKTANTIIKFLRNGLERK